MKKGFMYYLICWIALVALFNILCFVTPEIINGSSKYEGGFWPGYAFVMVSFLLHLLNARSAFHYEDKWDRGAKTTTIVVSSVELLK